MKNHSVQDDKINISIPNPKFRNLVLIEESVLNRRRPQNKQVQTVHKAGTQEYDYLPLDYGDIEGQSLNRI